MPLTDQQLAAAAARAGFSAEQIPIAVAVALAESGGNPNAHNGNAGTGDDSYGLWQINMLGAMGPARRAQFGLASNQALFDPDANARAAYGISGGGASWAPWSVYKSGAYRAYLPRAEAATATGIQAGWHIPGTDVEIPYPWELPGKAAEAAGDTLAGALGAAVEPFVTGLRRLSVVMVAVVGGVVLVTLGAWRSVKAADG